MGKRHKRILFFTLFIVALLLLVVVMFHTRKDEFRDTASRGGRFGFRSDLDVAPLPSLPPQKSAPMRQTGVTGTPATAEIEPLPVQPTIAQPATSAGPNPLSLRKFSPAKWLPESIAVVDMDKLLLAHPPASDSPEARADAINDIQRQQRFAPPHTIVRSFSTCRERA
jgi:hypothetical protein